MRDWEKNKKMLPIHTKFRLKMANEERGKAYIASFPDLVQSPPIRRRLLHVKKIGETPFLSRGEREKERVREKRKKKNKIPEREGISLSLSLFLSTSTSPPPRQNSLFFFLTNC